MSEAVNFYKEPGEPLDRAAIDLGPYVPAPDDDVLVCRCEEVTKGDIRRAIHDGMYTMTEIRRYLRQGMGLCQGQSCTKLVRRIMATELAGTPAVALLEPETSRAPMRPIEMSVLGNGEEGRAWPWRELMQISPTSPAMSSLSAPA